MSVNQSRYWSTAQSSPWYPFKDYLFSYHDFPSFLTLYLPLNGVTMIGRLRFAERVA